MLSTSALFLLGAAIGGAICWLISRSKISTEYDRARRESETERATILERLSGREAQIEELKDVLDRECEQSAKLRNENASAIAELSAIQVRLEEERKANRKFLMLETRGDQHKFAAAIGALGCEYALTGETRVKVVLQGGIEVRDLYRIAAQQNIQIRRLSYKRDSLEDIFLKAMENGHGGL